MKDLIIPEGYASVLSLRETERAIKAVKDILRAFACGTAEPRKDHRAAVCRKGERTQRRP